MPERDAKMTHAFEQASGALAEMAVALGGYRKHLEEDGGFTRGEAMALCLQYQQGMLMGSLIREPLEQGMRMIAEAIQRRSTGED